MAEEQILKRWNHASFDCILWTQGPGALDGVIIERGRALSNVKVTDSKEQIVAQQAIEAVADILRKPRGVWYLDPEPFTDLAMAPYPSDLDPREAARLQAPFVLADDLHVLPCEWSLWRTIAQACDAPGLNATPAIDLRGRPLYVFARISAPREPVYTWDSDGRLQRCLMLSRLVRPTSIGFAYTARLIGRLEGERLMIMPGPVRGFGAEAWTSEPKRNWLDMNDFAELRTLLSAFDASPFERPSRLAQALWYHEYACRTHLVDIRIPFVSTALEGLLSTSGDRSTQQFIKRIPQLANALGLPEISNATARRMWGLRSSLSHGESHGGLGTAEFEISRRMEELLRVTLKRAITDVLFRGHFTSRETLDTAFPIPPTPKRTKCSACGGALPRDQNAN